MKVWVMKEFNESVDGECSLLSASYCSSAKTLAHRDAPGGRDVVSILQGWRIGHQLVAIGKLKVTKS